MLVEERQLAIEVGGHWQEGFDPGLLWLFLARATQRRHAMLDDCREAPVDSSLHCGDIGSFRQSQNSHSSRGRKPSCQ